MLRLFLGLESKQFANSIASIVFWLLGLEGYYFSLHELIRCIMFVDRPFLPKGVTDYGGEACSL